MTYPSISTWILGGGAAALLSMINWYLWRFAPVLPYPLADKRARRELESAAGKPERGRLARNCSSHRDAARRK